MAKTSSFSNMVIVLTVIALVSATLLGGVYLLTEEPIAAAKVAKINASIAEVVPAFDNNPSAQPDTIVLENRKIILYTAKQGNEIVGVAVETSTGKGFSGLISLMVGFLPDGAIRNIVVLSHAETPGLGDKMEKGKGDFSLQFEGKHPETFKLAVKKDEGDVDAITASTITSRAYCDAVDRAYRAFLKIMEKQSQRTSEEKEENDE
ncbi:MAG: RnfABCDGE type electron transport complex subunit G [Bacteroidales bacterium]|nr:RnfABCDGE type electron transport complex subunit G [Bacteroidales bacterium]MCL2133151.1 RnfABCDGE type electron transport complex subunit G [Bacteroidales bacterium]